jgi:hypothetical protein
MWQSLVVTLLCCRRRASLSDFQVATYCVGMEARMHADGSASARFGTSGPRGLHPSCTMAICCASPAHRSPLLQRALIRVTARDHRNMHAVKLCLSTEYLSNRQNQDSGATVAPGSRPGGSGVQFHTIPARSAPACLPVCRRGADGEMEATGRGPSVRASSQSTYIQRHTRIPTFLFVSFSVLLVMLCFLFSSLWPLVSCVIFSSIHSFPGRTIHCRGNPRLRGSEELI